MQLVSRSTTVIAALLLAATGLPAFAGSEAHYLANAGVMIIAGDNKVVFDPLFSEDFGKYELVPADFQQRLIAGEPPFDGVDAVFVSHSHDDHFDPALMLEFLKRNETVRFYATRQAVDALRAHDPESTGVLGERLHGIVPKYGGEPLAIAVGDMQVFAINVPHAGWPESMRDVQNIAFSVALDAVTRVVHLGDADTSPEHYADDGDFWGSHPHDLALPPYWYFLSEKGRTVLEQHIAPRLAVGVHVPARVGDEPQDRPPEIRPFDLFTRPGETRDIGD